MSLRTVIINCLIEIIHIQSWTLSAQYERDLRSGILQCYNLYRYIWTMACKFGTIGAVYVHSMYRHMQSLICNTGDHFRYIYNVMPL